MFARYSHQHSNEISCTYTFVQDCIYKTLLPARLRGRRDRRRSLCLQCKENTRSIYVLYEKMHYKENAHIQTFIRYTGRVYPPPLSGYTESLGDYVFSRSCKCCSVVTVGVGVSSLFILWISVTDDAAFPSHHKFVLE